MRKLFAVVALGLLSVSCTSFGQLAVVNAAGPNKNVAAAPVQRVGDLYLTIYGERYAQVEETRKVHLEAGRNLITLSDIPSQFRDRSFVPLSSRLLKKGPERSFTYLSSTYQPANLSLDKLLASSLGQQIGVVTASGDHVVGELVSTSGNTVVLKTAAGQAVVVPVVGATFDRLPGDVSSHASLVVEAFADVAGDYEFRFMYETDGLTWSAGHTVVYNDDKSVIQSWETTVSLQNNSGASFEGARVSLLPSKVTSGEMGDGRMYAARGLQVASAPVGAAPGGSASVDSLGDQTTYTLPGVVTLNDGQSRHVRLFAAQDIAVKREYFIPANSISYYSKGKKEVSIRLEVDNCDKNGLGLALPAGSVKVYQRASANSPVQMVGSVELGAKAVDEVFQMVIGSSSELKWERVLVQKQPVTVPGAGQPAPGAYREVWEENTYKINVFNYKRDKDVEVLVEINVPADQSFGAPWTLKENVNQAQSKVQVPRSAQGAVQYKVKERVR